METKTKEEKKVIINEFREHIGRAIQLTEVLINDYQYDLSQTLDAIRDGSMEATKAGRLVIRSKKQTNLIIISEQLRLMQNFID